MFLEQSIGKTVFLNLQKGFAEQNRALLQLREDAQAVYVKVVAVDGVGIWIENPKWKTQPVGGEAEVHRVHVLVPWQALISVGVFPERSFKGTLAPEASGARPIGFDIGLKDGDR